MDVYFQDKTATRGDGSFEDTSETGSEDDQGHPPDDWRTEDHGHRGQSRDSLFAILSDPNLSIPESLPFVIVPPANHFRNAFSFYPSEPFALS